MTDKESKDPAGPGGGGGGGEANKALFLEKVRQSNCACQTGDFAKAISLYSEAIAMDKNNHILYSNRSAAYIKMGQFNKAYHDAVKAKELNSEWPKAYYREGVALQCLGKHADALASFSQGLAQDPKSLQLLAGLVEAAMKSPLKGTLEPTYRQLQTMKLDKSPFVIISVIGQELLAQTKYQAAVQVLESALKIGTCSLKLRGSVFSALSSAYWALNSLDKAINYMQQDLVVAKKLGDTSGECRAHGNLGSAYFSKGNYKDALTSNRYQLVLAMKCKDTSAAASALTSLGHVYTAICDYPNALASHKQCVDLMKQLGNELQEAREMGNVGAVYLAMGDFDNAVTCHMDHLKIAKKLANKIEEARAYSNLGSSHHYKRNFEQAIVFHNHVLRLAHELKDHTIEARAYAGLGHAARCMSKYTDAKTWHEQQLDMALKTRDKVAEGRACSNLGIVYQLLGDHDAALKLHQAHLNICRQLTDRAGMGRAFGNIGNAYSAMCYYEQAIKYHKQELTISKEVNDRSSEASTHGNLAVAYQALNMHEMALVHYHSHLNIARELKDSIGEACALCNLGNCHSSRGQFSQAVPFYENYLMLSQELNDIEGEAKACHFLGYAHYCLGNYKEAIRYYDQDLALARDLEDRMSMGRAYCNLGLAHSAIGNYENALECQKYFLAIAQVSKHNQAKFRALANMGDVLIKMTNLEEAIKVYQKQLSLSKQIQDKMFEASAFGWLGVCHRLLKRFDKSLGFHTQELSILQDIGDTSGECRAHGNLGAVHMSLGNNTLALRCFQEQLERARELKDANGEAQAFGNMGITRMNLSHFEEAIQNFESQLKSLDNSSKTGAKEKARVLGNLGDCYDALGNLQQSVKYHEQFLSLSLKSRSLRDQDKAYRGLGLTHKNLGNLQEALVCFEKRLVISHDLSETTATAAAYGELGDIHRLLGHFEQSISCMERRIEMARESTDEAGEAAAASGLGEVYQAMGQHDTALEYHMLDMEIGQRIGDKAAQIRASGNIGATYEAMKDYDKAGSYHDQLLNIATLVNDREAKIKAFSNLGRIEYQNGNITTAINYLQEGLHIAEQINKAEDEAKLRHRLGLALWQSKDLEGAREQLDAAAALFESIRHEVKGSPDVKLSFYDLQTACYHSLQRVLVLLGLENEALVVAERSRTRAFIDLLVERQTNKQRLSRKFDDNTPKSVQEIEKLVNRQKAVVLYYSLAAGYLYSWLIVPNEGIVRFHQVCLMDQEEQDEDSDRPESYKGGFLLENYIQNVRESLGIDTTSMCTDTAGHDNLDDTTDNNNANNGVWSNHLEELGDKLNQNTDRTGFLRMVNRSSRMNASSYSLSSLFSVGSVGGGSTISGLTSNSRGGSSRSRRYGWQGHSSLKDLYQLLIEPVEDDLPEGPSELRLVLEGDLYLVPFSVLKGTNCTDYLCERFSLLVSPSLTATKTRYSKPRPSSKEDPGSKTLIVGNPKIPSSVSEHWGWTDIIHAEQEANIVSEILGSRAMVGGAATKDAILSQMEEAETVHLACHVSWKLSAIIVSPTEFMESRSPGGGNPRRYSIHSDTIHEEEDVRSEATTIELPALSEFLLTAADLLNMKLSAKLVVISSCYTRDKHGSATSDGVIGLSRALLAAGAQCVLVSLWPVPDTAVKLIMKAFYSSLLQGSRVSKALSEAMMAVQTTKYFQHPANWAGFVLIGQDVKLCDKVALMGQALREIITTPDRCRDALRVTLHLVEKSLQRINRGYKNAMYTSQKSIENKVGSVNGWKDLLMSVGFRFEPAANGIPSAVFFPQNDPGERLTQCSASLQAILGLSPTSWSALSNLLSSPDSADEIMAMFRQVIGMFGPRDLEVESVKTPVNVRLWRVPGCHELLASLGFDLMEVGKDEVTLKTSKSANKRQIQFALQALVALFDTDEAPRSLAIDSSDSMEDLNQDDDISADSSSPPPPIPPFPAPRKSHLILDGSSGAFSSYARSRGEPDGRQHPDSPPGSTSPGVQSQPPPPLPPMMHHQANIYHQKGRESDCNFTPSPVDNFRGVQRYLANYSMGSSTGNSPRLNSTSVYSPNKFKHGPSPLSRPESCSSASSVQEWDHSNHLTVLRRQNNLSKLSPGVTDSSSSLSTLGLGFRKYLMSHGAGSLYDSNDNYQHVPVRSVFTESGYYSNKTKLIEQSSINDKLSIRAEVSKPTPAVRKKEGLAARLEPGVTTRVPPTGGSYSPPSSSASSQDIGTAGAGAVSAANKSETGVMMRNDNLGGEHSIKEHIKATQMRKINRELPISEVYHERSLGLGLAPPLSKLIMANNIAVAQVDHHQDPDSAASGGQNSQQPGHQVDNMSNFDNLSVIEDVPPTTTTTTSVRTKTKRPPVPPKPVSEPWMMTGAGLIKTDLKIQNQPPPARDDGDGRSMTDSQYSGCSPSAAGSSKDLSSKFNYAMKIRDKGVDNVQTYSNISQNIYNVPDDAPAGNTSDRQVTTVINTNIHPSDIAQYINNEFHSKKESSSSRTNNLHTHHPQIWSKDKNGRFTYNGSLASDC